MAVLERAGSRFAGWVSCLFLCFESDNGGQRQQQQQGKSVGRERDMQIYTQPQLAPPMRLATYDNNGFVTALPSPPTPPPSPHPRPHRIREKSMPSRRASIRASLSFNRKSTTAPSVIRISAPSDFRRVQSMTNFTPSQEKKNKKNQFLELSIYNNPHHQLPDLPSFDNFHLNDSSPLKRPPRVFSSPPIFSPPSAPSARSHRPGSSLSASASFHLTRKHVGAAPGPRRSSSSTAASRPTPQRLRHSVPTSPLIPHFAMIQKPVPRSLSMGTGTVDRDIKFTLQDSESTTTLTLTSTPPISPSPQSLSLSLSLSQTQPQQHKSLPLPPSHSHSRSQSQPDTHTRSWSGSTLASSTCTYNPTSPKGFDVSVIPSPGSRTGLAHVYSTPTIYEGEQVVGYI